ncbi:MAG: protein translocase subunit SecD [Phycisphaerales bacterium JB037]
MSNLGRNLVFVGILLAVFIFGIIPPDKRIRLGKDLRGGVTLVYQVQLDRGDDPSIVIPQMIEVLKERVDPTGLYEISMVRQGRDRIEITMPLPNDEIKALRNEFETRLNALSDIAVSAGDLDRVLRADDPSERQRLIEASAAGNASKAAILRSVADAWTLARETRAAYDALARTSEPDPAELEALSIAAADAQFEYVQARREALESAPSPAEVRSAVERSSESTVLFDREDNTRLELPSPRQQAIADLKQRFPEAADRIDAIVEAHDEYLANRTALDDPSELKRQLQSSGVLSFRITVDAQGPKALPQAEVQRLRNELQEKGPTEASGTNTRWFKLRRVDSWFNDADGFRRLEQSPQGYFASYGDTGYIVEPYQGEYWMLCYDEPGSRLTSSAEDARGEWGVASAFQGSDSRGRPAINFRMDARGAQLLGQLTGSHVGDNMAVLLDDQVYTAPNLLGRISRQGQITGNFPTREREDVIRILGAGSLQAKLSPEPISQSTVGPELGKDNLQAGLRAGVFALIAVSVFMVFYYFKCGAIAVVCLGCNAILILGALSYQQAALTLPGIAGIILTFGMAVDANVLIFERMREELRIGTDFKAAVRLGYQRALSSIVDGNVTNLIVAVVLVLPGVSTQEVKGFAITLGIGVVATLFSALVISRLIVYAFIQYGNWRKTSMLPMAVPAIEHALEPKIKWMKLRWVFVAISAGYIALGLGMVWKQGSKMLDTEFVGGTQVQLQFKDDAETGEPIVRSRQVIEDGLAAIERRARSDDDPSNDALADLASADLVALDPRDGADGLIVSDRYMIKTRIENDALLQSALQLEFQDLLDAQPPIQFENADDFRAVVFPITEPSLVDNLGTRTAGVPFEDRGQDVSAYPDGVIVLMEDLEPAPTLSALRTKLQQVRTVDPAYENARARPWALFILEGDENRVISAAMIARDPDISFGQPELWEEELARVEWQLARDALGRSTSMAELQKFSASIAQTFKARAVAAILLSFLLITIYIWVRFGSVRYSLAAITCLLHDVLTCIGLIALAEIIYEHPSTQGFAQSLGIMPFKIDLNMIAAILTIIGYSLNDTIIVMDRIRENRGKLPYASTEVIESSVNQTISRTVITSGTTLLAVLILYLIGGEGVRAFSYALLIGIGVGTYSSIAVAAPLVWSGKSEARHRRDRVDSEAEPPALEPPVG